jgi:hypothetical protein
MGDAGGFVHADTGKPLCADEQQELEAAVKKSTDRLIAAFPAQPQQQADVDVSACAAIILNPHYESFGKAFQDDCVRAEKYIRDAIQQALAAKEAEVNELRDIAREFHLHIAGCNTCNTDTRLAYMNRISAAISHV